MEDNFDFDKVFGLAPLVCPTMPGFPSYGVQAPYGFTMDHYGVEQGGGGITVEGEFGFPSIPDVTTLVFTGQNLSVTDDGGGQATVHVDVPNYNRLVGGIVAASYSSVTNVGIETLFTGLLLQNPAPGIVTITTSNASESAAGVVTKFGQRFGGYKGFSDGIALTVAGSNVSLGNEPVTGQIRWYSGHTPSKVFSVMTVPPGGPSQWALICYSHNAVLNNQYITFEANPSDTRPRFTFWAYDDVTPGGVRPDIAIGGSIGQTGTYNGLIFVSGLLTGGSFTEWVSPPASTSSTGTAGQKAYNSTHFFLCVATNTWGRVALDFAF